MQNQNRRTEISSKILQMSEALFKEGLETKDGAVIELATMLQVLGSSFTINEDRFMLSELIAMFSAKKVLDAMDQTGFDDIMGFCGGDNHPDDPASI